MPKNTKELSIDLDENLKLEDSIEFFDKYKDQVKKSNSVNLNFKKVKSISTAFVQVLVVFKNHAIENNKEFKVVNVPKNINQVLELIGFNELLIN